MIITVMIFAFGLIRFVKKHIIPQEKIVKKNNFIEDNIELHDSNYFMTVNSVINKDYLTITNKKGNYINLEGNFIVVNITIIKNPESNLKPHKIKNKNFKLKDHTGIYLPLNDLMGLLGWDAIDIHVDSKEGGHIMSTTKFNTISSLKDYNYHNKIIEYEKFNFNVIFNTKEKINIKKELIVLEVDFYRGYKKHKKGTDIILLKRTNNEKE